MKKIWLAIIMVCFCTVMYAAGVSAATWDGTAASGFAGGTGTEADPYRIATAEQLAFLTQSVNSGETYAGKYIKLTADIVLNDANSKRKWTPIGTYTDDTTNAPFSGIFDGDGHTVSGMFIEALNIPTWMSYQGLFGYTYNATFQNVTIADADITAADYVGALVGYARYYVENTNASYTISGCTVKDSSIVAEARVGGLIGLVYAKAQGTYNAITTVTVNIASCFNKQSDVKGEHNVGGIVGICAKQYAPYVQFTGNLTNCINNGDIYGVSSAGGIAGECGSFSFEDCINSGEISATSAGGITGRCTDGTSTFCNCINKGYITHSGSTTFVGGIIGYSSYNSTISFEDCANHGGIYSWSVYSTTDSSYSYSSAGGIAGHCESPATFTTCSNIGTIFSNAAHSSYSYAGGISGYCDSTATFTDCMNSEDVFSFSTQYDSYAGGTVGCCYSTATFTGCMNSGGISSSHYAGGIVGNCQYSVTFTNCMNSGIFFSESCTGGIMGYVKFSSIIENCYNTGSMPVPTCTDNTAQYAGGIAGYAVKSVIRNCYNIGTLYGYQKVGGIVGYIEGGELKTEAWVQNCYNHGEINGMKHDNSTPATYIGGIVGQAYNKVSVSNCYYLDGCASDNRGNVQNGIGSADCTVPTADVTGATVACTDTQMGQRSSFVGFDFSEIWTMAGEPSYPYPELVGMNHPPVVMPTTYTISGKITSVGTGDITISLLKDGTTVEGVTVTVNSTEGTYTIVDVPAGTYTMRVSKPRHITREYEVTVGNP